MKTGRDILVLTIVVLIVGGILDISLGISYPKDPKQLVSHWYWVITGGVFGFYIGRKASW